MSRKQTPPDSLKLVVYLAPDGDDATGELGNPDRPFRTLDGANVRFSEAIARAWTWQDRLDKLQAALPPDAT